MSVLVNLMTVNNPAVSSESELLRRKTLGNRLLGLRNAAYLSQSKMADKVGITIRSYRLIEAGDLQVTLASLLTISEEFNIELEWIATGVGPKVKCVRRELVEAAAMAVLEAMRVKPKSVPASKLASMIAHTHEQAWVGDQKPSLIANNLAQLISN